MYCKNINVLFIHITKTSGLSIKNTLRHLDNSDNTNFAGIKTHHKSVTDYIKEHNWTEEDLAKINTLSVIRNPYDRYLSFLNYANFRNWDRSKDNDKFNFLKPQHEYLCYRGKLVVKDILRFEDRESINNYFMDKWEMNIPHKNMTEVKIYDKLTEEQIKFCNQLYKKDFELFNYERIEL